MEEREVELIEVDPTLFVNLRTFICKSIMYFVSPHARWPQHEHALGRRLLSLLKIKRFSPVSAGSTLHSPRGWGGVKGVLNIALVAPVGLPLPSRWVLAVIWL